MFQSSQHNLLTGLFNLASEENFVQDGVDLVEVEHEVQLTDVPEELIEDFNEEVDGFEVSELVVVGVDADTEEEPCVAAVHNLCRGQVLAN